MAETMRYGDEGTVIRVTVTEGGAAFDCSTATVKVLRFRKPDGSVASVTASFYTNGTDGIVQYTTTTGDLDQVGKWTGQVYLELPSGKWHTDTFTVTVGEALA